MKLGSSCSSISEVLDIMKLALVLFVVVISSCYGGSTFHRQTDADLNRIRRQIALPEEPNMCSAFELENQTNSILCDPTYGQRLVEVYLKCGYNNSARERIRRCERGPNGQFCYRLKPELTEYVDAVRTNCRLPRQHQLQQCNQDYPSCAPALESLKRNFGCCTNNLLNNSQSVMRGTIADPRVWTNCAVDPPPLCSDSSLTYRIPHDDETCTRSELDKQLNRLYCDPTYQLPYLEVRKSCGQDDIVRTAINMCGVNEEAKFCFEVARAGSSYASRVNNVCLTGTAECTIQCRVALDTYNRQIGCCLNNIYNNKNSGYFRSTSPVLWSACGIDNPGFCQSTLGGSVATDANFLTAIVALLLVVNI